MPLAPPLMKAGRRVLLAAAPAVRPEAPLRARGVAAMTDRLLMYRYDGSNTNPDRAGRLSRWAIEMISLPAAWPSPT
jgi:hypothetical protein